jgi:hypothetical protein
MLSLASAVTAFAPVMPLAAPATRASAVTMETKADLEALASELNPVVGFWDPMNLVEYDQFSVGQEASIGFLRHAEIKHGRVAMAAFVGFIVQSNNIYFPFALTRSGTTYADISAAGGPADQWDALPTAAKLQILLVIGFLESCSESKYILEQDGNKHYMSGGVPGKFPSIKGIFPHPVPFDLYDPFGFSKNASPEKKARGLKTEINNGRAAMLGIMAFMAESKVPGAVPALGGLGIAPYSGEVMAPFSASDASLPFVKEMITYSLF